jgi:hypothetical protein
LLIQDPDDDTNTEMEFSKGIRRIRMRGKLEDPQVIDGDVLKVIDIVRGQAATQMIQPQTLGQNTSGVTFSQFALASKAGLIPAIDPKESQEALYRDAFTHILERIKYESIENELIQPSDIPDKIKVIVKIEPDLEQDDLRNSQVAQGLLNAGANVSKKWINTNVLKIADNTAMSREKKLEQLEDAVFANILNDPNILSEYVMAALGKKPTPPETTPTPTMTNPNDPSGELPMQGMEQMPKTDSMVLPEERQ